MKTVSCELQLVIVFVCFEEERVNFLFLRVTQTKLANLFHFNNHLLSLKVTIFFFCIALCIVIKIMIS